MAACSQRHTDNNLQILPKQHAVSIDSTSKKHATSSSLQTKLQQTQNTHVASSKDDKLSKNNAGNLSDLNDDEYTQLLEDAYRNNKDTNPVLLELFNEVEASDNDNAKSLVVEGKQAKHHNRRNKILLGDIYGHSGPQGHCSSNLKKRSVTRSLCLEGTRNKDEASSRHVGPRGVKTDHHSQSLQDLATMIGCENMKSAGVGRGMAKSPHKAVRANSFTHEACVNSDQKKMQHSNVNIKKGDKTNGPCKFADCDAVVGADKADCVKIDMMDIDDDDEVEMKEKVPLLQSKHDPFEEAVQLNSVNDNFNAVDDGIMFPMEPIKKDAKSTKDEPILADKLLSDMVPFNLSKSNIQNEDYNDRKTETADDHTKDDRKNKKKLSAFSLITLDDDNKKLDHNGNPIADNGVKNYGIMPNSITMLSSNTTTVYPANQTINLKPSAIVHSDQDQINSRKSKNRQKGNMIKAAEIPGNCGTEPIERLLDFINSTDKNARRGIKENSVLPESKKYADNKKDVKKRKKLSSSSSNNKGSAEEDTSSRNSSKGDPQSDVAAPNGIISDDLNRLLNACSNPPNVINRDKSSMNSDFCASDFNSYTVLDSQIFDDSNEFREVKNKKFRKKNKKNKVSRSVYHPHFGASNSRQNEVSSARNNDMLVLDGLSLSHKSTERSRRKSTSSMPPSENSSVENSDLDSVHSLPVVSKTAPPKLTKLPHTSPSSSSSTPHTSYADIAKMTTGVNHHKNSPISATVITEPDSLNSVPVLSPLTVENVAKITQIESAKCEQSYGCEAAAKKIDADSSNIAKHLAKINAESHKEVKVPESKVCQFPPLTATTSESSMHIASKTTCSPNTDNNKNSKTRTLSTLSCSSRPAVIIMDDPQYDDQHFDGELTFGFEINEKLLEMTADCFEAKDNSNVETVCEIETSDSVTPSFISPIYHPIEDPDNDRASYNYFENVKAVGAAWQKVQNELISENVHRRVCYFSCD